MRGDAALPPDVSVLSQRFSSCQTVGPCLRARCRSTGACNEALCCRLSSALSKVSGRPQNPTLLVPHAPPLAMIAATELYSRSSIAVSARSFADRWSPRAVCKYRAQEQDLCLGRDQFDRCAYGLSEISSSNESTACRRLLRGQRSAQRRFCFGTTCGRIVRKQRPPRSEPLFKWLVVTKCRTVAC